MNKKIIVFSMFATLFLSVYSVDKSSDEAYHEVKRLIMNNIGEIKYQRMKLVDDMEKVDLVKESFNVPKKQTVSLAGLCFSTYLPRGPLAMRATAMSFFGLTTGYCVLLTVTPRIQQKRLIELDKAMDRAEGDLRELNGYADAKKRAVESLELIRKEMGMTKEKSNEKYGK